MKLMFKCNRLLAHVESNSICAQQGMSEVISNL